VAGRFSGEQLNILDQQLAVFEAANPQILVELVEIRRDTSRYHEELARLLARGDSSLDVLLLNNDRLGTFASQGLLMPLNGYAEAQAIDEGSFLPASIEASSIKGQLMALPWTSQTGLLYYRQDLFDDYGLQPPGSWPDVERSALRILASRELEQGHVWQGAPYASLTANTLEVAEAFYAQVIDESGNVAFDSLEMRTALEQMVSLVASGASPTIVSTYSERESYQAFARGDAVSVRGWPSAWASLSGPGSQVSGSVGVAPLPSSVLYGQGLALSAFSIHPEQAFRLMTFLSGHDQQAQRAQAAGLAPTLRSVYEDAELQAVQPVLPSLYQSLLNAGLPPRTRWPDEVSEIIYTEVNSMLKGEQDAATTAATVQRQLELLLDQ
jgi:multiple sugar transport system substrate-binding protein